MKHISLPCGEMVPALGQGTWFLGDDPDTRRDEIAALQAGIERGLSLIDTAEMYGDGRAERVVGEAMAGRRDDVFLVSKVLPSNAGRQRAVTACEASLERLDIDCLDLYLLHWQGGVAYEDTIAAFEQLQREGKIRHFGISNLDLDATRRFHVAPGGEAMQVNQLLYNLNQRGIEWELLPWLQGRGVATMAYSPFDHADLLADERLQQFARERDITAAQAALAWLLNRDRVLPIPKSGNADRMVENAGALDVIFDAEDLATLDALFSPPVSVEPLQIY